MDNARLYLLVVASGVASALLVPLVRRFALAHGVVDRPDGRRVNLESTPRLGGVALFLACGIVLGLAWLLGSNLGDAVRVNPSGAAGFVLGVSLVFATGVVDDVVGLRPRTKLLFQVVAASLVVAYGGCRMSALSLPGGPVELGVLGAPLTVLWIVTLTNAVNLMDGLDGLAAGVAAIALGAIVVIASPAHGSVAVVAAVLLGACIGFLAHNFQPASIFMGDSGSLFLGFSLGVLSTYASAKTATGAITLVPVLIVALPLADTFWTMARRYGRGLVPISARSHLAGIARIFVPDRQHIHHRLVRAGLDPRSAIHVLYGIQGAACAGAIYLALVVGGHDEPPPEPSQASPGPEIIESRPTSALSHEGAPAQATLGVPPADNRP